MKIRMNQYVTRCLLVSLVAAIVLAGCEQPPLEAVERIPVIETVEVGEAEVSGLRKLPARIEASDRAELSFRVPGKLDQLLVAEGFDVEQGQLLAVLDQKDFKTELVDAQAAFDRADADYARAQQLISGGNISRSDYDQIEARFKNTRARLGKARVNLEYTELRAPFSGVLAQRHVENFEEIQQGQAIFSLRSIDQIDVKFDVPESLIILVTDRGGPDRRDNIVVTARFDARPDVDYPLTFKEVATRADPMKKAFEVTYLMDAPKDFNVLPGMLADVTINMPSLRGAVFSIPTRAVFGDIYMEPRVWLLDTESMTVALKPVQIGRLDGDSVEVTEGLQPGDVVVTSPTNFLLEGQKVQRTDGSLDAIEAEAS